MRLFDSRKAIWFGKQLPTIPTVLEINEKNK